MRPGHRQPTTENLSVRIAAPLKFPPACRWILGGTFRMTRFSAEPRWEDCGRRSLISIFASQARKRCARQAGIANLAPHDLRRTCARLCHDCSGELEQIRFLLGHASVQTTERYIGSKQKLQNAVNDRFEISVASDTA